MAYDWLFYKFLKLPKQNPLDKVGYQKDFKVEFSLEVVEELSWWDSQIMLTKNKIRDYTFYLTILSDASNTG